MDEKKASPIPSGTVYGAILHKNWLSNILNGELAELPPWITPYGEVFPIIGFKEMMLESLEIEGPEDSAGKIFTTKLDRNIL